MNIVRNWLEVQENIEKACFKSGRDPKSITVVAVTKYLDVEQLKAVFEAGLEHIGENRVQDALPKWEEYRERGTWRFDSAILQTNKVKYVLGKFKYIHSLDRLSLAEEIEKGRLNRSLSFPVLFRSMYRVRNQNMGWLPMKWNPLSNSWRPIPIFKR